MAAGCELAGKPRNFWGGGRGERGEGAKSSEGRKINFQLATRNFLGAGRDSSRRRRAAAFDMTRTCGRFTRLRAKVVS